MSAPNSNTNNIIPKRKAIVKQVLSGDTVVIRGEPRGQKPPEKTVILMGIAAPKLPRKSKVASDIKEEAFGWEAREYLRKKLVGEEVFFSSKPFPGSNTTDRELGQIFYPNEEDNVIEGLVENGFVQVKKERVSGKQAEDPAVKKLFDLESKAKSKNLGIWRSDKDRHVRNPITPEYIKSYVDNLKKKPIDAVIESVRCGKSQLMLDVTLLSNFHEITLAVSGIKFSEDQDYTKTDQIKDEAKFFVEKRLLQRDVQVVLERDGKNFFVGSVLHPNGNIAERLLQDGFVMCDDRTVVSAYGGPAKLRAAEKVAKDKRLRTWKDVTITAVPKVQKNELHGVVVEILNSEGIFVKVADKSEPEKIFFSGIRAAKPKEENGENVPPSNRSKSIFDTPLLFEAREFLRKKLIGKKVTAIIDYIQPASDRFPEKKCCTVKVGNTNIAEALVASGFATVLKSRDNNDRISYFDELGAAEEKAKDNKKGIYSEKDRAPLRINDLTGLHQTKNALGHLPMLQKQDRINAIVEYVASGSRMRLYLPKDSMVITFLLSGIICPRASARNPRNGSPSPGEPLGDEALNFTKEKIMHREVEIRVESMDKKGGMVGTLTINNVNLALALVEAGLARVFESSTTNRTLIQAGKVAQEKKIGLWQFVQEECKPTVEDDAPERRVNYIEAYVSVISPELHIYAQHRNEKKSLEDLSVQLQQELASQTLDTFSRERVPTRNKLVAAKFSLDNQWYRGKIEKNVNSESKSLVNFIDYGNREYVSYVDMAVLPDSLSHPKAFAHEYALACLESPPENYFDDVAQELMREIGDRTVNLNVEYMDKNLPHVTLHDPETKVDLNKLCIEKGLFYVQRRREGKLQALIKAYNEAEELAKKERNMIWEYGDARADDAKEFGA